MSKTRYLQLDLDEICFSTRKMAFISGPRQVGKTTFAKNLLTQHETGRYYTWDEITFRRLWTKDPSQIVPAASQSHPPLLVLDEIHKAKAWKRTLKGLYDTLTSPCNIIVTGSAKLNVYRRGSDSLLGRYYHFRLHPFSYCEMAYNGSAASISPVNLLDDLFHHKKSIQPMPDLLSQLMRFGGFPEPLISQSPRQLNLWQRNRVERLIREDLRDLSRLPHLSQVEMLASLLPERVASPLSITSLAQDLEVAFNTAKHWVNYLKELYYCYEIKPFSTSLPRTIRKEGKLYLWDWSEVKNEGARFENMIASHLLKYVHYLNDTGFGDYALHYLRNKEKKEIDFLITKNQQPWLPIEVKLSASQPTSNWSAFMPYLKLKKALQVVATQHIFKIYAQAGFEVLVISADSFLSYLI